LSEWVRDVLLGSSVETGTLAAERAMLFPTDEDLSVGGPGTWPRCWRCGRFF
jgi:hypothetical protein